MNQMKQVVCPVCGKRHNVAQVAQPKNTYLDMVPKYNMQEYMSVYIVCECGMLCFNKAHELPAPEKLIALPRYQEALHASADIDEQKFMVMTYGLQYQWAPIYAAHFYAQAHNEEKRAKWLQIALQRAQDGYDYNIQLAEPSRFDALKIKKSFFDSKFMYTLNHKYIELYRQLGLFDKATSLCYKLEANQLSTHERAFVEYEKQLIQRQDKSVY